MKWSLLYSIIDHVSVILAIPIAAIGFAITIVQIRKTKAAAEASYEAATAAKHDASRSGVLVLLPQLQRIEEQIESAVDTGRTELFISWINAWRWQAGQLNGYLSTSDRENPNLANLIQNSVALAAIVKSSVVGKANVDLVKATKRAREAIAEVTSQLGGLVATYSLNPEEGTDAATRNR